MVPWLDRRRRAGRFLEWKVALFVSGAVLGISGILLDEAWLRIGAIAVLASGMLLRFLPGGGPVPDEEEADEGVDSDDDTGAASSGGWPEARA